MSPLRRLRLVLMSLGLISVPLSAAPTGPVDPSGFTILDLVQTGVMGIPGCINFCVTGACTHIRISGLHIRVIVSPQISHNMPEWVVQSYRQNGQQPWMEWREVFAKPIGTVSNQLARLIGLPPMSGLGSFQEENHNSYDQHLPFKETEIHGHPLNVLSWEIQNGGASGRPPANLRGAMQQSPTTDCNVTPSTGTGTATTTPNTCDYSAASSAGAGLLSSGFPQSFNSPALNNVFNYRTLQKNTQDAISGNPAVSGVIRTIAQMSNYGNNSLCPTTSMPFMPYFLSEMDFWAWRAPEPEWISHFAEMGQEATVGLVPNTLPDLRIGNGVNNWGWLYPRVGFANEAHDGKVASMTTIRVQDLLLAKEGQDRGIHNFMIYPQVGFPNDPDYKDTPYAYHQSGIDGGTWQKVWPKASYSCQPSLFSPMNYLSPVDDSAPRNITKGRYAWAFWRHYECCMNRSGRLIAIVHLPTPLCLHVPSLPDPSSAKEL